MGSDFSECVEDAGQEEYDGQVHVSRYQGMLAQAEEGVGQMVGDGGEGTPKMLVPKHTIARHENELKT